MIRWRVGTTGNYRETVVLNLKTKSEKHPLSTIILGTHVLSAGWRLAIGADTGSAGKTTVQTMLTSREA
jgi:hypothetical protein